MRLALLAALVVASVAVAQDDPFVKGEALQDVIRKNCTDGCVTFSREEAAKFEEALQKLLDRKMQEAFQNGVQFQRQACASLV